MAAQGYSRSAAAQAAQDEFASLSAVLVSRSVRAVF